MGLDFNINIVENATVENGFIKVLDSATGMMLIKKEVILAMENHYRESLFDVNDIMGDHHRVKDYVAIFDCMIDPVTKRYLSEDYAFCRRWQQLGGSIWVDISTPLCHVGNASFDGDIRQRMVMAA